jgi:hypothetical protein
LCSADTHAAFQQALRQHGRQWDIVGAACGMNAADAEAHFRSVKAQIKQAEVAQLDTDEAQREAGGVLSRAADPDDIAPDIEIYSQTSGSWIAATVVEDHRDEVLCRYRVGATGARRKMVRKGAGIRQPAVTTTALSREEAVGGMRVTLMIREDEVEVGEVVGRGALGEVRRGVYRGNEVALKALHLLRTDTTSIIAMGGHLPPEVRRAQIVALMRECELLRDSVSPYIVPLVGVVQRGSEPLYLATQYIHSGTLHDLVHSERYAAMRTVTRCERGCSQSTCRACSIG